MGENKSNEGSWLEITQNSESGLIATIFWHPSSAEFGLNAGHRC